MKKKRERNASDQTNSERQGPDDADERGCPATPAGGAHENARPSAHQPDLESLQKELAEAKDGLLRARAELQNARRRFDNERGELVRYANAGMVKSLLATLDDLERVLGHGAPDSQDPITQGVRLVYDNFKKTLSEHRVEPIDALGQPFDPRFHEALQQRRVADQPPGTVVEVFRPGYRMEDRILRPAQVIVAAVPDEGESERAGSEADIQSTGVSRSE